MNAARIYALADHIERLGPDEFTMARYFFTTELDESGQKCGTPACIAGHAIAKYEGSFDPLEETPMTAAGRILGISDEIMRWGLFMPANFIYYTLDGMKYRGDPFSVNNKGAAMVLRHFAETGKIEWHIAYEHMNTQEIGDVVEVRHTL